MYVEGGLSQIRSHMEKLLQKKTLMFWVEVAMCGKTFAVGFLQTYIADQQGHDSQLPLSEKPWNHANFSSMEVFLYTVLMYKIHYYV